MKTQRDTVPNQVFIGCPWRIILPKYEAVLPELRKKYPISFVIVGRGDRQDAKDLLDYIKQSLLASSYAVFDATGGNANVSLEYGFAEGRAIDLALYACTHAATKNAAGKEAIISDLAGKSRNHYKQKEELERLLSHLCVDHSYTKRFERFLRNEFRRASKGEKKSARALALKIIHALDKRPERRRDDLVQEILAAGYSGVEINKMLTSLHRAKLINCSVGKYSVVTIT